MAQKRSDNKMQALSLGGLADGAFTRGYQAPQNGCAPIWGSALRTPTQTYIETSAHLGLSPSIRQLLELIAWLSV